VRLAIELDGGQQAFSVHRDARRDDWLRQRGVTVLRFWNSDVTENFSGVLEIVASKISELRARGITPTWRWRAGVSRSEGEAC
jgi:very-short-patch-repair endonuclease